MQQPSEIHRILYLAAYQKLTRIARNTDRSEMTAETHREFLVILDRAQKIINLEAQQTGYADLTERQ